MPIPGCGWGQPCADQIAIGGSKMRPRTTGAYLFIVVDERWSTLTPALSPRRGSAMEPPEQFIIFAAFGSAANAEENVLIFRAVAALPLLGERAGVRVGVFQPRSPDALHYRARGKNLVSDGRIL